MISLDTNVVISAINPRPSLVRERLNAVLAVEDTLYISSIVVFELQYGIAKGSQRESNTTKLARFMSKAVRPLAFDEEDGKEAGEIRAALELSGTPIGFYDVLIAAQARRRGALLVTANTREFARIPGLRIEDWTIPI